MTDLFEEVEDELRTEQFKRMALRLAPWVIGGLLLAGAAAAVAYGYQRYEAQNAAKAAAAYAGAMQDLGRGDNAAATKALDGIKGSKAYRSMALMLKAGMAEQDGKTADAAKLFDQAAAAAPSGKDGLILADTARLKAVWSLMDTSPYGEIEKRLEPLTQSGRPLRGLAQEALNMAMLNAGMVGKARVGAVRLSAAPDAPAGVAQRAQIMVNVIDSGAAAGMPALTKAAVAAPPAPKSFQLTPDVIQRLTEQAQAQQAASGAQPAPKDAGK